jgi:hypothetical protein
VMEVWLLTAKEAGTVLNETVGAPGPLLHPTSRAIVLKPIRRRIDLRNVISHLR